MERKIGPYVLRHKLSQTDHSATFLAQHISSAFLTTQVVIKLHKRPHAQTTQLIQQAQVLSQIHHPHLARVLGAMPWKNQTAVVYEFIPGWDLPVLVDKIAPMRCLTLNQTRLLALSVLDAMSLATARLHENDLIHGDIHPRNIRITPNLEIKLVDFDASVFFNPSISAKALGIRPRWSAPEKLHDLVEHPSHDIYSLAVLVHYLSEAFEELNKDDDFGSIVHTAGIIKQSPPDKRISIWQTLAPQIHSKRAKAESQVGLVLKHTIQTLWHTHSEASHTVALPDLRMRKRRREFWFATTGSLIAVALVLCALTWFRVDPKPKSKPVAIQTIKSPPPVQTTISKKQRQTGPIQMIPLLIQAKPWAHIHINGKLKGTTPLVVKVPSHRFPIQIKASFENKTQTRIIKKDHTRATTKTTRRITFDMSG